MIAGYEHRFQVEAQLALEREKGSGHMNPSWLQKIETEEAIFRAELERMDREGDFVEPEVPKGFGTLAYVGTFGRGRLIA